MAPEENKAVARRALEDVWGRGDLDAVEQVYAPGFVSHQHSHPQGPDDLGDLAALKAFVRELHDAMPDFHNSVEEQIAEGDRVATRFTSQGTHRGTLMGVAGTGRRLSWMGITIDRVSDGHIAENWVSWDLAGLLQQIGTTGQSA